MKACQAADLSANSDLPDHIQSWALSVFFNYFNNKICFPIFYKVNILFLHQSYLKSPLPAKLTLFKMQENHFSLLKKI